MIVTIHKGRHRPRFWWLRWPFYFNAQVIECEFIFDFSCVYLLANGDQEDRNKLFGISYSLSPHKESARVAFRYSPEKRLFIMSGYCYVQGQRIMIDLCDVMVNRKYLGRIVVKKGYYQFLIFQKEDMAPMGIDSVPKWHNRKFGFKLGLFFGGNQTAPHDITIQIKKV